MLSIANRAVVVTRIHAAGPPPGRERRASHGAGPVRDSVRDAGKPGLLTDVIVEILTVFILVEVLGVSVRFLRANRIDVRDLVDVTLAIIFREIWVGVFSQELHWQEMVAIAALIIALGGIRFSLTEPHPSVRSLLIEGEAAETEEA